MAYRELLRFMLVGGYQVNRKLVLEEQQSFIKGVSQLGSSFTDKLPQFVDAQPTATCTKSVCHIMSMATWKSTSAWELDTEIGPASLRSAHHPAKESPAPQADP